MTSERILISGRDEAQARIITLREKAEKEFQAYMQEVKELDRTIEHDRKLREFLMTKAVDRTESADGDSPKKLSKKGITFRVYRKL